MTKGWKETRERQERTRERGGKEIGKRPINDRIDHTRTVFDIYRTPVNTPYRSTSVENLGLRFRK